MVEACNNERKIVFYGIFKGIFSKLLNMPILPRFPLPIFTKGDRSCASNYRGITSLCAVSKAFELLLAPIYIATSYYIMDNQNGFVPKHSTLTNLTVFVSFCKRNLDSGGRVDTIYTDLKAAFDLISHDILIAKLQKLGFSEQIVIWLNSYLTERSYKIKVNDHTSRDTWHRRGTSKQQFRPVALHPIAQ